MKLPYGASNFEQVRTEGYYYIDKTHYIEILEKQPERHIVILRSRRFGKTLFCNMLGWYYDRRRDKRFAELFKGTYIHEHPTPKRNSYLMLTFNFSGINTQTLENANEGFAAEVLRRVKLFTGLYREHFSPAERKFILAQPTPNDILSALFDKIAEEDLGKCVYIVIDEYDHFANNLMSQGKEMFKDLVKTDGYVRPFYEALKKGAETVVDRIFITGVMPILLDSLTSGFNIAMNLSTDIRFNEMLGFTDEEITPILESLFPTEVEEMREILRSYYDGYRFSPRAEQTVYNSDMVLYYGVRYDPQHRYIESMMDVNVVSDYRKIRAILSIGEKALEESVLTQIVRDKVISVRGIQQLFVLTWETEFLFNQGALVSLLFYMGYLTISDRRGLTIFLRMPNVVLESLYLEYMERLLMVRGEVRIGSDDKLEMLEQLVVGNPSMLISLTEQMLKGLSNRDNPSTGRLRAQKFDEKYIKVVMLSLLSDVDVYIPHSEYEVSADGYVDIYLQAVFEPNRSVHFFFELKYAKAKTSNKRLDSVEKKGKKAMAKYLATQTAQVIPNLQPYLLIFRKDRCARKIHCSV
ncbi:AAA family ATPase [Anaerolineales bacterium HSG24]|nr:AAA family ATPase [Anaerolineales bacterium HSG24]